MKGRRILSVTLLVVVAVALVSFVGFNTLIIDKGIANVLSEISLSPPSVSAATATFLDDEAGIAGYAQVSWDASTNPQTWNNVKSQLQTIEKEGDNYVVGTFALTDYSPRWDPHVYVDKDGWVVAYWPKDESRAIFLDIKAGFGKTHAQRAIAVIAASGGVATPSIGYYDFTNPTANRIVVASLPTTQIGDAQFSVTRPTGIALLAAGWVFRDTQQDSRCFSNSSQFSIGSRRLACASDYDAIRGIYIPRIGWLSSVDIPVDTETFFEVSEGTASGRATYTSVVLVIRES